MQRVSFLGFLYVIYLMVVIVSVGQTYPVFRLARGAVGKSVVERVLQTDRRAQVTPCVLISIFAWGKSVSTAAHGGFIRRVVSAGSTISVSTRFCEGARVHAPQQLCEKSSASSLVTATIL